MPLLAYHRFKVSTRHSLQPCYLSFILKYSHLVHHVSTCARPCTVTITSNYNKFHLFKRNVVLSVYVNHFFKSGSDQSLKIDRFPRLLFLLTNPRCPFKTCFLPPCRCCHHFSPSQRVATRWSKCLGPLGSPHMSHVFER